MSYVDRRLAVVTIGLGGRLGGHRSAAEIVPVVVNRLRMEFISRGISPDAAHLAMRGPIGGLAMGLSVLSRVCRGAPRSRGGAVRNCNRATLTLVHADELGKCFDTVSWLGQRLPEHLSFEPKSGQNHPSTLASKVGSDDWGFSLLSSTQQPRRLNCLSQRRSVLRKRIYSLDLCFLFWLNHGAHRRDRENGSPSAGSA